MSAEQEQAKDSSLMRIWKGAVLALIILSVICQGIAFGIAWSGGAEAVEPGIRQVFELFRIVIVPGTILALIQFLLNVIHAFGSANARTDAAVYLVIACLPIGLSLASPHSMHTPPGVATQDAPKSAQFLEGYNWAKQGMPAMDSECRGSHEFNRGCWTFIQERRDELLQTGREWAKNNRPAKASECKGAVPFIKGCRAYFYEHLGSPMPPGNGVYVGMTTAECVTEVNANYEALTQEFIENGNPRGAVETRRRRWIPELRDCENFDKFAENTFMPQAYNRLQALIDKLKAGGTISEEEKAGMLKDYAAMSRIRDQPYRTAYFERADEYLARLNGQYRAPVVVYPNFTCAEYQAKIDEMKKLDTERAAAMRAFKHGDTIEGGRRDGVTYNDLNQQRIAMLGDWKYFTDGAKAAGCAIH